MRFLLFALVGLAAAKDSVQGYLEKPAYVKVPKAEWARKPHKAKSDGETEITPIVYTPIAQQKAAAAENEGKNGMHQRAADNKVIIHHDDNAYNSTGTYEGGSKTGGENCCRVCPKDATCTSGPNCFHKCATVCGAQCGIPMGSQECTIGKDCGFQRGGQGDKSIQGDQDMVKGYEKLKAPARPGIKQRPGPKKEWARPPLPAKKASDAPTEAPDAPTGPAEATGPTGPPAEDTEAEEQEAKEDAEDAKEDAEDAKEALKEKSDEAKEATDAVKEAADLSDAKDADKEEAAGDDKSAKDTPPADDKAKDTPPADDGKDLPEVEDDGKAAEKEQKEMIEEAKEAAQKEAQADEDDELDEDGKKKKKKFLR